MNHRAPATMDPARFLEMVALGSHSLRLVVYQEDGTTGVVDIESGVIRHVTLRDLVGRAALDSLMGGPTASIEARPLPPILEETELDLPVHEFLANQPPGPDPDLHMETRPVTVESPEGAAPEDPADAAFTEGVEAMLRHDLAAAREAFRRVLRLRPDHARARHNLSRIEEMLPDFEEGRTHDE